jgi:hypothetical protein
MMSVFKRVATGVTMAAVLMAPAACDDDDPSSPTVVATNNLVASASLANIGAITGNTFTIANGGAMISPALAGQAVSLSFSRTGTAAPTAQMVVGGTTISSNVTFGSCIFTITAITGANAAGLVVGQVITVNPCNINIGTEGVEADGAANLRNVTITFGTASSNAITANIIITPSGQVIIRKTDGTEVSVGTVNTTNVS